MSENDKLDTVSSQNDTKPQEAPRRRRRPVGYQVAENNLNPQEEVPQVSAQYTHVPHNEPFEYNQNSRTQEPKHDVQIQQEHTEIEYNTRKKKKVNPKKTSSLIDIEKRKKRRHRIKIVLGVLLLILIVLSIIPYVISRIQSAKWDAAFSEALEKNFEINLYTDLTSSGLVIGSKFGEDGSKSVKCISSPTVDGVITLYLPDTPLTISNTNQTLTITNFEIKSINKYSDELLFSGEVESNLHGTAPISLKWSLCDSNGNAIIHRKKDTPYLATGEKLQSYSGIDFDIQLLLLALNPGEYTFNFSLEDISVAESVPPVTNTPVVDTERPSNSSKSIQYTLPNNAGSVEIALPQTPLTLSDQSASLTITDFKQNLVEDYLCELLYSGEINHSKFGTKSHLFNWRILDHEGYVISSGYVGTPSLAEGEKFRDYPCVEFYYGEIWGGLAPGKYTLQLYF